MKSGYTKMEKVSPSDIKSAETLVVMTYSISGTKHNLKCRTNTNLLFAYMQAQQLLSHFRSQREAANGRGKS